MRVRATSQRVVFYSVDRTYRVDRTYSVDRTSHTRMYTCKGIVEWTVLMTLNPNIETRRSLGVLSNPKKTFGLEVRTGTKKNG